MANLAQTDSAIGTLVRELAKFLKLNVANIKTSLEGWPATNEKLVYPAISVFAKTPTYTPLMPYVVERSAADPVTHASVIRKAVAQLELELQLDLWSEYKPQRDSFVQDTLLAFNRADVPGVNLTLPAYYNEICHLSVSKIEYVDDEAGVQRGEWRAIVTVLATLRVFAVQTGYLMETIDNTLQIPEQIDVALDTDDAALF